MPDGLSDEALAARARGGDEMAFVLLYERHRDMVFRFAWRMLGAPDAAEDVTHDCFLALLTRPGRFDPTRASLRTYLCAAARNQALKRLRYDGREVAEEEMPERPGEREPLREMLEGEVSRLVQEAVGALPPLQREALILLSYEGLSLAEAAEVVGADVGAVKARLHRARESLRRRLAPFRNMSPVVAGAGGADGGRT